MKIRSEKDMDNEEKLDKAYEAHGKKLREREAKKQQIIDVIKRNEDATRLFNEYDTISEEIYMLKLLETEINRKLHP